MKGRTRSKSVSNICSDINVEYEYDEEKETYLRNMLGEPHVDKEAEEQIEAANIMIIAATHRVVDNVGRREINVYGPGKGWIVQKGKVREIVWERKDGIIRPYINGEEVPLDSRQNLGASDFPGSQSHLLRADENTEA